MSPIFKWLLTVSLALNAGMIGAVVVDTVNKQRAPAVHAQPGLPDYLQLSAEQRRRWRELEPTFLSDLMHNWQAIKEHRQLLVTQIFSTTPDRALINAQQATIAALQDAQQRRVIAQLLAEREVLDEAQRKKLMDLLLQRYAAETTEEERLHNGRAHAQPTF